MNKKNDVAPWWVASLVAVGLILFPEPATTAAGVILLTASVGYKVLL
jgi:hypothetical protein